MSDENLILKLPGTQIGTCGLINATRGMLDYLGWRVEQRGFSGLLVIKSPKGVQSVNLGANPLEKDLASVFLGMRALNLVEKDNGSLMWRVNTSFVGKRRKPQNHFRARFDYQRMNIFNPKTDLGSWMWDNPLLRLYDEASLQDEIPVEFDACSKHSFKFFHKNDLDWWQSECYLTPSAIPSHSTYNF